MVQSRRVFLKKSCAACLGMSALGIFLDACNATQVVLKSAVEKNRLAIPLEKFQRTQSIILRNSDLAYDILVVKHDDQYSALQMRCTHNDVALQFTGKKLVCHAHGSEFDLNGKVVKEPATGALTRYKTTIDKNQLIIFLSQLAEH